MDPETRELPEEQVCNPFDMNSTQFNSDLYMNKLLKDSRLSELMDTEQMLYKQIQTLDSEMQTLIYENYNKFISATETVRKMTSHFDKMEHELNLLSENMEKITRKSNEIAGNLSGKRDQLSQLASTHFLLNKVQFILELPDKMKSLIGEDRLYEAIDNYLNAKYALDRYSHFSSFENIQIECLEMLEQVKTRLYEQLSDEEASTSKINDTIEYLVKINENPTILCEKYFEMCDKKLRTTLNEMREQLEVDSLNKPVMDILEFIDNVCNNHLGSLNHCITFYSDIFMNREKIKIESTHGEIESKLKAFVDRQMDELFEIILRRIKQEQQVPNNIIMLVRALDRFYKRVQRLNKIYSFTDFTEKGLNIVYESTRDQCRLLYANLTTKYQEELATLRHDIINDIGKGSGLTPGDQLKSDGSKHSLSDSVIAFETAICEHLKTLLSSLNPFLYPELSFFNKEFRDKFVANCIFDDIVVRYVRYILESAVECEKSCTTSHLPSQLVLLFSKLCLDLSNSIIAYLLSFTEEMLNAGSVARRFGPPLSKEARACAQRLLKSYVCVEGQSISHMIRKSVETRDWLGSVEPRSVRSVMKRVIEDISVVDFHVGQLFEEGVRVERSSDSSRTFSTFSKSTRQAKSTWSYSNSSFDNSIISNIQKLFNDKIEIFGKVEFSRLSVVTGIIKIGLKTLIECVRLCTFSRYGFQQIQVDSYYLQIRLWKFASDEKIIVTLIDEVVSSAKKRCLDSVGMEKSVIENICDSA